MIQSISSYSYSSNVNFKAKIPFNGFYDPTCVSIPSSVKESVVEKVNEGLSSITESSAVKASINEFKANFMPEISEKVNSIVSEIAQKGSVVTDKLSDGFIGVDKSTGALEVLNSAGILSSKSTDGAVDVASEYPSFIARAIDEPTGIKIIDANNWYNPETGIWTHVASDGASTVTFHVDKFEVMSLSPDSLAGSNMRMIDANNWYNTETGELTHLLPDGSTAITIAEGVDIPEPPVVPDPPEPPDWDFIEYIKEVLEKIVDYIGG